MATIRKEVTLDAAPDAVWEAFCDFHAVHERVARGFVTASKVAGETVRTVTFANGVSVREDLISLDQAARRMAYTASGGQLQHHNGVFEVGPAAAGTRLVWTIDLLPDAAAPVISGMMEAGCAAMRQTFEVRNEVSGQGRLAAGCA